MTNLNTTMLQPDPLQEAELDAAIARHFGPRRHTHWRDFGDTVPVQPVWQQQHGCLAACTSNACRSGDDPCPTPDACRVPDSVTGARIGALVLLLSAVFVVSGIAAVIAWWPA